MLSREATPIASVQARWRRFRLAETDASDLVSAACYRLTEDIRVGAVVVPELKLRDVQRHVFAADLVEAADDAALEDAPETFNRVGVNRADNVLASGMMRALVRIFCQSAVNPAFVRREQADFIGNHFANECLCVVCADPPQYTSNDVTLAADRANDRGLADRAATDTPAPAMFIDCLAADERFVHFNDAAEFIHVFLDQGGADTVAHVPSGFVATETHDALNLQGAHSLFTCQHQMSDAKPVPQILIRVLENRPGDGGEPIALRRALPALPVEGLVAGGVIKVRIAAAGAMDAFRPAAGDQIAVTGFLIREGRLELGDAHLGDGFRSFRHDFLQSVGEYCHA
jgi:hypothetical protein